MGKLSAELAAVDYRASAAVAAAAPLSPYGKQRRGTIDNQSYTAARCCATRSGASCGAPRAGAGPVMGNAACSPAKVEPVDVTQATAWAVQVSRLIAAEAAEQREVKAS